MSIDIAFRGYLGQPPTLRFTTTGNPVAEFRVGINRRTQRDGEWVDAPTTWLTVTAFGQLAENAAESLDKGDPVAVKGELITEAWTSKTDDEIRTAQKVLASEITIPLNSHTVNGVRRTRKPSSQE